MNTYLKILVKLILINILFINPTSPKILIGMEYTFKFLFTESVVLQNLKEKLQELQSEMLIYKNPKAANKIVHLKRPILELRFKNCFFHSGGMCFS